MSRSVTGSGGTRAPRVRLENRTGYDTRDLERFVRKGLIATGTRGGRGELRVVFTASPIRSRGCAEVGTIECKSGVTPSKPGESVAMGCTRQNGNRMVIAIASPAHFSLRRLARLFMHESAHIRGYEHADMDRNLLLSLGPTPEWARDCTFRYYGPAPSQIPYLRHPESRAKHDI